MLAPNVQPAGWLVPGRYGTNKFSLNVTVMDDAPKSLTPRLRTLPVSCNSIQSRLRDRRLVPQRLDSILYFCQIVYMTNNDVGSLKSPMRLLTFHRMRLGAVIVIPLAVVPLAACGGSPSVADGELAKVTVSVTHPEDLYGLPWEVGQEQGFFEDAGVQIEQVIPSEGGGSTLQNVVSGRLPFGEVATGAIVSGFNEGAPIQVIGGGIQSVADVLWVALPDSDLSIETAGDARWGFTNPGSVTEAMSFLTPEGAGLDPTAMDRTSTGGTGAGIALLEAGDVDLTYASPRVAMENAERLKVIGSSADYVPVYQQTLIISSRDYASKNPETARGVLQGYANAIEWIKSNPKEAAELWAGIADLNVEDAQEILDVALAADHWGVAYNPEALETAANGLSYTDGLAEVNWGELLTDKYLPEGQKGEIP